MKITDKDIAKQEKQAWKIMGILLFLLILYLFLVMLFQFGWFGRTAANGIVLPISTQTPSTSETLTPTPESTPAAVPTATPTAEVASSSSEASNNIDISSKQQPRPVTSESVGATYLTWIFASWAGVCVYLLKMCARRYYKIGDPDTDFFKYTPWYIINFFRAPLLAIVVMWILTTVDIELGTTGSPGAILNFKELPSVVLLSIAFILGLYARVCKEQLNLITKAIFPKAWVMAMEEFTVNGPDTLLLKGEVTFTTDPTSDVIWAATLGTIDPETGVYQAPSDISTDNRTVIVRASLRNDPSKTNFKEVTLKLFKIEVEGNLIEANVGDSIKLSLIPGLSDQVNTADLKDIHWSSSHGGKFEPTSGSSSTYTVPEIDVGTVSKPMEKTIKLSVKFSYKDNIYNADTSIVIKPKP